MEKSAKALTVCTVVGLVVATGYTVAVGSSGWLWFAWIVLAMVTIGVLTSRS